jgi:hypothetical protein
MKVKDSSRAQLIGDAVDVAQQKATRSPNRGQFVKNGLCNDG